MQCRLPSRSLQKAARRPKKCRRRYSRALHAGFRLAFRKKRHRRAQRRRVTTSHKIPLVNTKIPTVPNSSGGWTLNRTVASLQKRKECMWEEVGRVYTPIWLTSDRIHPWQRHRRISCGERIHTLFSPTTTSHKLTIHFLL